MENHLYICEYCSKKYLPRRRHKQRFCSNSCRVNAHNRKRKLLLLSKNKGLNKPSDHQTKNGITWGGIGNAAIANVATEVGKSIFIKEENKPATKGDIQNLANKIGERYILIKNMDARADGAPAYFDTTLKEIVHLKFLPTWK
ncbi:hypothetical protein [Salinimicrobium gaetbulicola]|uniref:Uncharacterized protein n=1 Tax=Salinimicrobium gaetbulicola TaxID=999702 RepID=A0ABW3IFC8_9FLAO